MPKPQAEAREVSAELCATRRIEIDVTVSQVIHADAVADIEWSDCWLNFCDLWNVIKKLIVCYDLDLISPQQSKTALMKSPPTHGGHRTL